MKSSSADLQPRIASAGAAAAAASGIRFERSGATVVATLDRPSRLNAINSSIKASIAHEIPVIARDPQVYAVIFRSAPNKFYSAGGDIREFRELALSAPQAALDECRREYSNIWLLDCFSKPTIVLMDGAVLGTAAGMAAVATHRVAGANYRFQMPETYIGYFPDNGVAWRLAQLPHEIGTYLGLTGASIDRADAYWLGLVTHCIDAGEFDAIVSAIADANPIDPQLDMRHVDPGPAPLASRASVIERCFSGTTVEGIKARLASETEDREWCHQQIARLDDCSPLALEATLMLIRRARVLDLRQMLQLEYRLARHFVFANDFLEGVQVRVIDKARQGTLPGWRPAVLSDISPEEVERLFEPRNEGEMNLPTREEMQASRV